MKSLKLMTDGPQRETASSHMALLSWKSLLAGLLVALFTHAALTVLGAAIGASALSSQILQSNEDSLSQLTGGAVVWMAASVLISLALGSYFATRASTFVTRRVGAAHGIVIAALFFIVMIYGVGQTLSAAGQSLGQVTHQLGNRLGMGAAQMASHPAVLNVIEKALPGTSLKSDPAVIAQGVAVRLLRGSPDSARNYFSYQTGISQEEINTRFAAIEEEVRAALNKVGVQIANTVSTASWSLFWILILGTLSATIAGTYASAVNFKKPLSEDSRDLSIPFMAQPAR